MSTTWGTGTACPSGARTAYSSGASECTSSFWWCLCCSIFNFLCSVSFIIVRPFIPFLLYIALSVTGLTASDYAFGIFKISF